ncbi:ribonuclease III [Patescibacteria group bacterium]|nr:ribonuclease III [Patescibacteria group bacterium]MBU1501066.1 ribonuclease III [Patescibacteria group bacterium]MBU2081061.1 ribonuclease III [Patescibacteria group bacterium]MBU2124152.1 ribonuclease III [Patescibacteria group bacterium]MBU2195008.1 ribonuclease III [Patescibacteria group bacterium]
MSDFAAHAEKLGVQFNNLDLLIEALTHRSYLNEHRTAGNHNERLEFLGDAVLELAVTHFLFTRFPNKPEGELTAYRAALVNTYSLAEEAERLGVNDMLLLSKGERKDTGRARQIILANAFEAILGAIYLDQGYESVDAFISKNLNPKIEEVIAKRTWQDAKSHFQEIAQEKRGVTPTYKTLTEEGPDHDKRFTIGVFLGDKEIARGEGSSKQEAEQVAAQGALEKIG